MKWEMEFEEVEAVLEKIWELHDKLSDAIHSISRSHFLNSVKFLNRNSDDIFVSRQRTHDKTKSLSDSDADTNHHGNGFVYAKEFRPQEDITAIQEIKSLNAIRTALENLEDQLEFFHAVQTQQRAERDAAITRLEQSRIVLAMRLAEHQGKKYKVLEEAQAFVGDVSDADRFISPENLYDSVGSPTDEKFVQHERCNVFSRVLMSTFNFVRKSLRLDNMGGMVGNCVGGLFGNAALVAVSMLALMHVHQVNLKQNHTLEYLPRQEDLFYNRNVTKVSRGEETSGRSSQMDVLLARG